MSHQLCDKDGFIDEEPEEIPSEAVMQRQRLALDRQHREVEYMDEEQVAAHFARKYGGRRTQAFTSSEDVPQQLLLPSVNDPNLWMVKCRVCLSSAQRDIYLFTVFLNSPAKNETLSLEL